MKEMFEESEDINDRDLNSFRVNKKFEKRFLRRKKREELERAKQKYGKNFERIMAEELSSGSSLEEDSDAELVNDGIELKFMTTLAKIKTKDPEIYDSKKRFFGDDDFKHEEVLLGKRGRKEEKKLTYKDQVRNQALKGIQDEENYEENLPQKKLKVETPYDIEMRNKSDFQKAAAWEDESESESDDDFLRKKDKTDKEMLNEEQEFQKFVDQKKKENEKEAEGLQELWGNTKKLSDEDKFLKKFFLTKAWIDDDDDGFDGFNQFKEADEEDVVKDEEVDKFEAKINFRHEEGKEGNKLKFYERDIKGTLRREDKKTKRAEKRIELRERKRREKDERKKEMKKLKEIKKSMIEEKIKKLERVSGLKSQSQFKKLQELVKGNFSAKEYDREMQKIYNEDYFESEEEGEDDLKKYVKEIESKYDNTIKGEKFEMNEKRGKKEPVLDAHDELILNPRPNLPVELKKKLTKAEASEMAKSLNEPIWWYCDACFKGIQPKQPRYECLECPDYTECRECSGYKKHDHQMKKFIVPDGCYPPPEEEIYKILEKFVLCNECELKMDDTYTYYQDKEDEDYFICEGCMNFNIEDIKKKKVNGNTMKDFKIIKPKRINIQRELENDNIHKLKGENPELDNMIDDYMNIDFEDIIAGGIKTRFRYTDVEKNDFLLSNDELLYCDDKLLNQYLSLKKIAPYKDQRREISQKRWKRMKKMRTLVRNNAERNKEKFNKEIKLLRKEELLRNKAKKNPKMKKKLEKFMLKKDDKIKKIYRGGQVKAEIMLTDMTKAEVDKAIKNEGGLVSDDRLKSYY